MLNFTLQNNDGNSPSKEIFLTATGIASKMLAPYMGSLCYSTQNDPSQILIDGLIGAGIISYFQQLSLGIEVGWIRGTGSYLNLTYQPVVSIKKAAFSLFDCSCTMFSNEAAHVLPHSLEMQQSNLEPSQLNSV